MRKSILQSLFDGEVYPAEEIKGSAQENSALNQKIVDEREYFKSILSEENQERMESLNDLEYDRASAYGFECFAYGFRLGVALILEIMQC